jgi:hypothetical protein
MLTKRACCRFVLSIGLAGASNSPLISISERGPQFFIANSVAVRSPRLLVSIPPGVRHWHGASPNQAMTHIAVQEHLNGRFVGWQGRVSDAQYALPVKPSSDAAVPVPSMLRRSFGRSDA